MVCQNNILIRCFVSRSMHFLYEGVSVESHMPLPFVPHCGTENNTTNNKKTKQLRLRCHIVAIAHDWLSSYWCTCVHHMTIGWSWSGRVSGHWSGDTGGDGAGRGRVAPCSLGDILVIVTQGATGLAAAPSPLGHWVTLLTQRHRRRRGWPRPRHLLVTR